MRFSGSGFDFAVYVSGSGSHLHGARDADVRPVHEVSREERAHDRRSHLPCGVGFKDLISQKVFEKLLCKSQFPHKFVNRSLTITTIEGSQGRN